MDDGCNSSLGLKAPHSAFENVSMNEAVRPEHSGCTDMLPSRKSVARVYALKPGEDIMSSPAARGIFSIND
jgi:hypothetical protein